VSCALAVNRQKTQRSPASRVGRPSLRNGTQSRAVRRPRVARSVVVPRFDCSHPPRMANFCGSKSTCRLAFRVSSIPHWELGSAAIGNRAASREGAGAEWLSQMSTTGEMRLVAISGFALEKGCTLLLCDGLVRPGTWMESTTYCLSGKEGFKAACAQRYGGGGVGGDGSRGHAANRFPNLQKRQVRSSRYAFSGDNDLGLTLASL
jgi:hypothetical protein